jgi:hypothetical protein
VNIDAAYIPPVEIWNHLALVPLTVTHKPIERNRLWHMIPVLATIRIERQLLPGIGNV